MKVLNQADKDYLMSTIRDVKDFPKAGIVFKDITTLLNNEKAYNFLMDHLASRYMGENIDFIAGIESRGFIFGAALAAKIGCGFVPIRKPGKLPYTTVSEKYALEYGVDEIEIHIDAFQSPKESPKVLLIDDLIATGGTAAAAVTLLKKVGVDCFEACFLINLKFLAGDKKIEEQTSVYSVLEVD